MKLLRLAFLVMMTNATLFWGDGAAFSPHSSILPLSSPRNSRLINGRQLLPVSMRMTKQSETDQFDFSDPLRPVVFGQKLVIPFTDASFEVGNLTNQGSYSWLVPYITLFGYKQGNRLVGGIPVKAESSTLTEAEITALREKAALEMTNIGDAERARRALLGNYMYVAAGLYAAISAILLDDGSLSGHLIRFAILPTLFLARGLQLSAQAGL
jgi:hypothetical protein